MDGYIESPGYPVGYDNFEDCQTNITQPAGSTMTLTFLDFELEEYLPDCPYDWVQVLNTVIYGPHAVDGTILVQKTNYDYGLNTI